MIRIANLTLARGARRLLEDTSLSVHVGHKVGLVGRNGAGKTTLLRLLKGEIAPDDGSISIPRNARIGHVAQEASATCQDGGRKFNFLPGGIGYAGKVSERVE